MIFYDDDETEKSGGGGNGMSKERKGHKSSPISCTTC